MSVEQHCRCCLKRKNIQVSDSKKITKWRLLSDEERDAIKLAWWREQFAPYQQKVQRWLFSEEAKTFREKYKMKKEPSVEIDLICTSRFANHISCNWFSVDARECNTEGTITTFTDFGKIHNKAGETRGFPVLTDTKMQDEKGWYDLKTIDVCFNPRVIHYQTNDQDTSGKEETDAPKTEWNRCGADMVNGYWWSQENPEKDYEKMRLYIQTLRGKILPNILTAILQCLPLGTHMTRHVFHNKRQRTT